jgi:hypothetical protein
MVPSDRRQVLRIFSGALAGSAFTFASPCRAPAATFARSSAPVDVTTFRRNSDREDTWAFLRAFRASRKIFAPKGQGLAADGSYLVSGLAMPSYSEVYGEGQETVFRPVSASRPMCFVVQSVHGGGPVRSLIVRDLTLVGLAVEHGFAEHNHLINLNGVQAVRLVNLHLRGFQGDGIYFGTGLKGPGDRKNCDITIESCSFDGLNHQNRNAISIIDGVGVRILNCNFVRCTRQDMPGAIDFEPNAPGQEQVGMIEIRNCKFTNCGGMAGQISLIAPNAEGSFVSSAVIEDNVFFGSVGTGPDIQIDVQPPLTRAPRPSHEILVRRNVGTNGSRPMHCKAAGILKCSSNQWSVYKEGSIIGTARGPTVQHFTISDQYEKVGLSGPYGAALEIRDLDFARVDGATFVDCGRKGSAVIKFFDGRTRDFQIANSTFVATDQTANVIAYVERGYDFRSVEPSGWLKGKAPNRFVGFKELVRNGRASVRM